MKKLFIMIILIAALVFSCSKDKTGSPNSKGENFNKDASYALGMNVGMNFAYNGIEPDIDGFKKGIKEGLAAKDQSYMRGLTIGASLAEDGIFPNIDELIAGLKDMLAGNETRIEAYEAMEIVQAAYMEIQEAKAGKENNSSNDNLQKGTDFLLENMKNPDVKITSSGLQYEVITEGSGPKPKISDRVKVHYEGQLIDGAIFDSSYQRGIPAEFNLDEVISGWTEGLQLMNVGSIYKFYIPNNLGYGSMSQGSIPAYSVLIFEVDLVDIIK